MSELKELQDKADKLQQAQHEWFTNLSGISIGIDWDSPSMVICDINSPDGPIIQYCGMSDYETIYEEEAE